MATEIDITSNPGKISQSEFNELVRDLMENSITGDVSPFNNIKDLLNDELDNSPDLDPSQKAGVMSDFLRDTFMDINKQSMSMALEILKTNEELSLKSYSVESDYNLGLGKIDNMAAENDILLKSLQLKEQETALMNEKVLESQLNQLETRAKLKKQYGVVDILTYTAADPTKSYAEFSDGRWYEADPVTGVFVTDGEGNKIPMLISGTSPITQELANTTEPGAIDKQIAGYDKVNYKDLIKTYNENIAMLSNAQVAPPGWMIDITKLLTEMVTDGQLDILGRSNLTLGTDSNPDTTSVNYNANGTVPGLD